MRRLRSTSICDITNIMPMLHGTFQCNIPLNHKRGKHNLFLTLQVKYKRAAREVEAEVDYIWKALFFLHSCGFLSHTEN